MGTISISYSELNDAVSETGKLCKALNDYQSAISRTVLGETGKLVGNDDKGYINTAEERARRKISELGANSSEIGTFKKSLSEFVSIAKDADASVAKDINTVASGYIKKRNFFQKIGDAIYNFCCVDLANIVPVLSFISDVIKSGWRRLEKGFESIKNWFKYKAGKYILNEILSFVGFVAAAVTAVVSLVTAGTALAIAAAIASVVVAVIAGINCVFSCLNNQKAYDEYNAGNLGYSRYHGSISSMSDAIDKYDLGGKRINKIARGIGDFVNATEKTCKVLIAINGVANLGGVKDENGIVRGYSRDAFKKNMKELFGIKTSKFRYSIDPKTNNPIPYDGAESGYHYAVEEKWSFKNLFSGRKNGTSKQYVYKFFGGGASDDFIYNKHFISNMSMDPGKTVQTTKNLFGQLTGTQKTFKVIADTAGVIDKTKSRIDSIRTIRGTTETVFDKAPRTWDKVKATFSLFDSAKVVKNVKSIIDIGDKGIGAEKDWGKSRGNIFDAVLP